MRGTTLKLRSIERAKRVASRDGRAAGIARWSRSKSRLESLTALRPMRTRLLTSTALVAAGMSLSGGPALAGPQQGTVAAGQASISQSGPSTTITQSTGKAIINWFGFSIGAGESVQFQQPGRSAVTLNRVQGPDSSEILG